MEIDTITLPPIIPLLFYTGEEDWNIPSLAEALKFPEEFRPLTPAQPLLSIGFHMEGRENLLESGTALGESCRLLSLVEVEKAVFKEELRKIHLRVMEIYHGKKGIYRRFLQFVVSVIYHRRGPEEREEMIQFIQSYTKPEDIKEVAEMKKTIADVIFEEGAVKKSQENILEFLQARFGEVGPGITQQVKAMQDQEHLNRLIRLAATCTSIEDFEKGM